MKNKTKGLIALIAMTAAAAAAAGSSTFAWFQTNRTVKLAFNTVTIQKRGSNELKAELKLLGTGTLAEDKHSLTVASADKASDISSKDGTQLYSPVWNAHVGNGEKVASVATVIDAANSKAGSWFTEFAFKVTNYQNNVNDTTKLNVFFDDKTVLKAVAVDGYTAEDETTVTTYETEDGHGGIQQSVYETAKTRVDQHKANEAAAKWSRVAIISLSGEPANYAATGSESTLSPAAVMTFENKATGTEGDSYDKFIASTTLTDSEMEISTTWTGTRHYVNGVANNYFVDPEDHVAAISNKTPAQIEALTGGDAVVANGFLTQLDAGQTKWYIARVWLEGTENDNQEIANHGEIALDLSLASYVGA